MGKTRCQRAAWNSPKKALTAVTDAAIDAKLTQWQAVVLLKGEQNVEYSRRFFGLVAESDSAAHAVLKVENERVLLRGMPKDYDMNDGVIMSLPHGYGAAVSKVIVRKFRLRMTEDVLPLVLVTSARHEQKSCKFFFCG